MGYNKDILSVDEYIASFPTDIRLMLERIRAIIKELAPEAKESISYGMPAYKTQGKPLIYFAAQKKHIGLYATPAGNTAINGELSKYKQGKGSVQFPYVQPFPYDLISRIVACRVSENMNNKLMKN